MKRYIEIAASAAVVLSLAGCATTGSSDPATYEPAKSRAYNLAQAGGITEARDTERKHLSENELYKVASNADILMWDRGANWSGGEALGASLLFAALEPTSNFAKDSLFGWMPSSMATDAVQARAKMSEVTTSAMKNALGSLGYTYEATLENYDQKAVFGGGSAFLFSQITIIAANQGCPSPDSVDHYSKTCYVSSQIIEPNQGFEPAFLGGGQAWSFTTEGVKASSVKLNVPEGVTLDSVSIIGAISANLPGWAYMFTPQTDDTPPMVVNKGKPLYFVEPVSNDGKNSPNTQSD